MELLQECYLLSSSDEGENEQNEEEDEDEDENEGFVEFQPSKRQKLSLTTEKKVTTPIFQPDIHSLNDLLENEFVEAIRNELLSFRQMCDDDRVEPPVLPTSAEALAREKLVEWLCFHLKQLISPVHSLIDQTVFEPQIKPFGSFPSGTFGPSSDIDLNVSLVQRREMEDGRDTNEEDKQTSVSPPPSIKNLFPPLLSAVKELSRKRGGIRVGTVISTAHYPVLPLSTPLRSFVPEGGENCARKKVPKNVQVELTVQEGNDASHLDHITRWTQAQITRISDLSFICRLIKVWSSRKGINNTYGGSLSTLGFLVLLFSCVDDELVAVAACRGNRKEERQTTKEEKEKEETRRLVSVFLRFLHKGWEMTASADLMAEKRFRQPPKCIRTKDSVGHDQWPQDEDVLRFLESTKDFHCSGFGRMVFIQDPFLVSVNLGRFVDHSSISHLREAFEDGLKVMEDCFHKHNRLSSPSTKKPTNSFLKLLGGKEKRISHQSLNF